jgi:hypothetical protein
MLHSVLPHQHHSDLEQTEHSQTHRQADGLMDFIKLIFHQDMGEGHMENFEQGQSLDISLSFTIDDSQNLDQFKDYHSSILSIYFNESDRSYLYYDDIPILKRYVIEHLDLRGPPISA